MNIKNNYNHTIYASYLGYITQAIVNNFAPLLFLTFQNTYNITLDKIALLVTMNFSVQLLVDFVCAKIVDKIGYKKCIVLAHILSALGLSGLAVLPEMFGYKGILLSVFVYAAGGGIIEVLVSPIVEACPTENKSAVMSLLHSFYCWGHVFVVVASTVFFSVFGIDKWKILAVIWSVIPLFNAFYFANVPIQTLNQKEEEISLKELFSLKIFWLFAVVMICAGASEQAVSQWASAFAELGLGVSKTTGDLLGPCLFAVLMGISRVFYAKYSQKVELEGFMLGSTVLCIISYICIAFSPINILSLIGCGICGFSVGIMWPGTFSLASKKCAGGGTAMFALLALAGDLGCSGGPTLVGFVSKQFSNNLKAGIISAIVFPVVLFIGLLVLKVTDRKK